MATRPKFKVAESSVSGTGALRGGVATEENYAQHVIIVLFYRKTNSDIVLVALCHFAKKKSSYFRIYPSHPVRTVLYVYDTVNNIHKINK